MGGVKERLKNTSVNVKYLLILIFSVLLPASWPGSAQADGARCDAGGLCTVPSGAGTYRVVEPSGWDGGAPLAAAMFFHGYRGSSGAILRDTGLLDAFDRAGILLIVPDGKDGSWSHQGSPSQARDDIAFVQEVIGTVAERYPLDRPLFWAVGFSQGGSMVWDLACRGGGFSAYVAISGAFWDPIPRDCPAGPADLLHIHGFADRTVPLEGRAIRERFHQSDLFASLDVMRRVDGCRSNPDETAIEGETWCRRWTKSCETGRTLELCLHPGGHGLPEGWFERAWSWVEARASEKRRSGAP